jgi:predicted nucleic acid-binding protein
VTHADAVRIAHRYAAALGLLLTTPEDLERGLDLFERYPALGAFDAVLAAVALERGAQALVSADRAFGSVGGLRWVDPAGARLRQLIGE